jgi:PHD/YefM family antitoxin component YafN of YafNO toxin-antitoxin module
MSVKKEQTVRKERPYDHDYLVDKHGTKKAIIVPIEEYKELLEDLHDLAVIAERRNEPTVPFEEVIERLKRDGLL